MCIKNIEILIINVHHNKLIINNVFKQTMAFCITMLC